METLKLEKTGIRSLEGGYLSPSLHICTMIPESLCNGSNNVIGDITSEYDTSEWEELI